MNLLVLTLAAGLTATATAGQSTIDLHFEGGTVQQWVAAIKSVSPKSNIIVSQSVGTAQVGAMDLHGVSVASLMQLWNVSKASPITCDKVDEGGDPIWLISGSSQAVIRGNRGSNSGTYRPTLDTAILNLPEHYVSGDGPARVVELIHGVCGMESSQPVKISILKGTGVIAVYGTSSQRTVADEVIDALNRAQPPESDTKASASISDVSKRHARQASRRRLIAQAHAIDRDNATTPEARRDAVAMFKETMGELRQHRAETTP
jgi:hypothetical protein